MIDQTNKALLTGNYVGVRDVVQKHRIFLKSAPINLCCASVTPLSEIWGHVLPPAQWRRRLWYLVLTVYVGLLILLT